MLNPHRFVLHPEKRRQALERSFFHDLLNTAGGLGGLLEALASEAPEDLRPDLEVAQTGFREKDTSRAASVSPAGRKTRRSSA